MFILLFSSTLFGDYYISQGKKQALTALDAKEPFSKSRSAKPTLKYYKNKAGERLGVDKNSSSLFWTYLSNII